MKVTRLSHGSTTFPAIVTGLRILSLTPCERGIEARRGRPAMIADEKPPFTRD
jgi:hypothetical protein